MRPRAEIDITSSNDLLLRELLFGEQVQLLIPSAGQTHLPCKIQDGLLDMQVRDSPKLLLRVS
jgi:hypothetical protein